MLINLFIISLNARGLRDYVKREALLLFGKKYNTDFGFFQESHSTVNDCNFWKSQWGNAWFSHGSERSAGVLTLKNKFAGDVLHYYCDPCGHFIFFGFFTLITFSFF